MPDSDQPASSGQIVDLSTMSPDDLFALAAGGAAPAQEMMCHRILKDYPVTPESFAIAEQWAAMSVARGHRLSYMTIAQICAGRGMVHGQHGRDDAMVEDLAQAVSMFDCLSELGDSYSMSVQERLFGALKADGAEDIHASVLKRAKEMQAAW